ncbi:MAG: anaerobic ribonucleoside-triphosphate reductase activating protein [Muribaculaceae bacterium]|nr:anaerobic ribonucleoside-triphosphate reductase activating protein [Muribaculaceae bacterium]
MQQPSYNVLDIRRGTTVDGPGLRTSIYLAGCNHKCPGCHNPDSWDPAAGTSMTLSEILAVVEDEDFDVTLTGGDPLMNAEKLPPLIKGIKALGKSVWIYTGYTISRIRLSSLLRKAVEGADAIVEGPFKIELLDPDLRFRGSSNQRIIEISSR